MSTQTAPPPTRTDPPATARHRTCAFRAVAVAVGALLLGALLNAEPLADTAEIQPAGWRRDAAVAITGWLVDLSRDLYLDRPRAWLDDLLDEEREPGPSPQPTPSPTPTEPTETPTSPEPTPSPTAAPTPDKRVATAEDPATMLVAGDSLTESLGPALARLALETGVIDPAHELQYSSGLTRRELWDWPQRLERILQERPADIVVFMIGANDAQAIQSVSGWIGFGEPGWVDEYRARVDEAMTTLERGADTIYWVGQPIPRSADFRARMQLLNDIGREVAENHPRVRWVSSWELFSTPDGGYSDYLPDENGRPTLVRRTDGIHLTPAGASWLADHLLTVIQEDWTFSP